MFTRNIWNSFTLSHANVSNGGNKKAPLTRGPCGDTFCWFRDGSPALCLCVCTRNNARHKTRELWRRPASPPPRWRMAPRSGGINNSSQEPRTPSQEWLIYAPSLCTIISEPRFRPSVVCSSSFLLLKLWFIRQECFPAEECSWSSPRGWLRVGCDVVPPIRGSMFTRYLCRDLSARLAVSHPIPSTWSPWA